LSERDEKHKEIVDDWLARAVTPKVERYLEDNREKIVERYGTDKPHIDLVRKRRYPTKPSESSESADPIDIALELRDAIEAVERRSFVLPLAMHHIGGLLAYFEVCLRDRDVPRSLMEKHMKEMTGMLRREKETSKKEDLDEILAGPLWEVEEAWKGGNERTHIQMAEWILEEYPHLVEGIVDIKKPPLIKGKKREDWTWEDKYYNARQTLIKEIKKIDKKHDFNRVFGKKGVKKKT
jgi:hypothetical protein